MYFQLNDNFIAQRSEPFREWLQSIQYFSGEKPGNAKKNNRLDLPNSKAYLLFCTFCRRNGILGTARMAKPLFCPFCGEASAVDSYYMNVSRVRTLLSHSAAISDPELSPILL